MNIIDFIPEGKENAVTREYLCSVTGFPDRKIRDEIARARLDCAILNLSDGKGYYRPTKDDYADLRRYKKQEENRIRSISMGLNPIRLLLSVNKKKSDCIEGQMDIFQMINQEE